MAHKNKENYSPYKARQEKAVRDLKSVEMIASQRGVHKRAEKIYPVNEANDRLFDIFKNHNFKCTHEERLKLSQFYRLLLENQEHKNFTRLLNIKDIGIKHFIDCLILTEICELKFPLLDVGTGPGFPGIPLKIRFPDEQIILAEGVQTRVEFLKHVRLQMNFKNLDIIGRNINPYFMYPVNGVITRAVEDVTNTLKNTVNCLQLGGHVYFMKGPGVDPEIEKAQNEMSEFFKLVNDITYDLPKTENHRRLVIFEKIKHAELPEDDDNDILLNDSF